MTVADHAAQCADHAAQYAARYKGEIVEAATPDEMRRAIMVGRLMSRENGVAVYAYNGRLYLLSNHDLAEAGI